MSDITWVGCWWDLGRDCKPYQESLKKILELPINLVIFVQTGNSHIITDITDSKEVSIIQLKVIELNQLPLNFPIDVVTNKYLLNKNPHFNPKKDTPEYCILQCNKFALIGLAINDNQFNTKHFGWLDLGLGRIADLSALPKLDDWLKSKPHRLDRQVRFCLIKNTGLKNSSRKEFYNLAHGYIVSGLFLGSTSSMKNLINMFNKEVNICYQEDIITLEEKILMYLYAKYPQWFSFHFGDYADCLDNWIGAIKNLSFLVYFLEKETDKMLTKKRLLHIWKGALKTGNFNVYNQYGINNGFLAHRTILNHNGLTQTITKQLQMFQLIKNGINSNYFCPNYNIIIMMVDYPDGFLLTIARNLSLRYRILLITKMTLSDLSFCDTVNVNKETRDQVAQLINPCYYQVSDYNAINWDILNKFLQCYIDVMVYNPLGYPVKINHQYQPTKYNLLGILLNK